jgi:signal transduction histidine kinase
MAKPLRLLIVEDSEDDATLVVRHLNRAGYQVEFRRVDTAEALTAALAVGPWDLVLSDYSMPHFSGTAALQSLRESGLDIPFIFVSGTIGEDVAVDAMKSGASDYIMKGRLARLVPAIERELRESQARRERKLLENQLRQAQKMEVVGRLAGGVAHDFNNVLGVVIGYSEILLQAFEGDERVVPRLEEIKKAALRGASLTRQLLAFSRQQILEAKVLDLNKLILDLKGMLARLIGEDLEIVTTLQADLGRIKADPGQIEQVILNLVINARDAMPDGGRITIESSNVELDSQYANQHFPVVPGRYVMVAVTDTGIGMDEETRARVFEPFFTTKEQGKGTGLGLSTAYGIVKQSGGYIWVYSEVGRGTSFKVYLPHVKEKMGNASAPVPDSRPLRGSETILLVEDEVPLRRLTCELLQQSGYTVLEAESAPRALDIAERHSGTIHLLCTDVVMPGTSGSELAKKLGALRAGMKVLFMSGYTTDAIVRHGVLEAGVAFLQKPYSQLALTRKVREVLDSA